MKRRAQARRRSVEARRKKEEMLKPSELKARRKIRRRRRFVVWIILWALFFASLVFALYNTSRHESMLIQSISVAGVREASESAIKAAVFAGLEGSVLGVFPKSNAFFVPKTDIEKALLEEFTRLRSADVVREGATGLLVSIQERFPAFVVCSSGDGVCLLGDRTGFLFAATTRTDPEAEGLPLFSSGEGAQIGTRILPEENISALILFRESLERQGIGVERIEVVDDTDVRIVTDREYDILAQITDDYTDAFLNLVSALDADLLKQELSEKHVYEIDLRFGNKVFYRFE